MDSVGLLTGQKHENRGRGYVAGWPLPTADYARPERRENRQEGDYEEGYNRPAHVWKKSFG